MGEQVSILRLFVTIAGVWTGAAFGAMFFPQIVAGIALAVGVYIVVVSQP